MSIVYEVIYSDWFIINMKEHVSPKDLYNLKMTTKYHYKMITYLDIKHVIIINVLKMLQDKINVKLCDLLTFMNRYKISISGSFIVQCILNEYWPDSDIDLYTKSDINLGKNIFTDNGYSVSAYTTENEYSMLGSIKTIGNFEKPDKTKVQLIILDTDKNMCKYVKTMYDFDVCKNIFNIKNGKYNLKIHNLQSIINKQISCNFLGMSCTMSKRKLRYEERGFIFKNHIIGNHIYYNGELIPIIMCNNETKQISIFKEKFIVDKLEKHNLGDEWFYMDLACENGTQDHFSNGHCNMEIKDLFLPAHSKTCGKIDLVKTVRNIEYNCPIKHLDSNISHYHSSIKYKNSGSIHYASSILIEYTDNETLKLHNKNDGKHDDLFINFKQFYKKMDFPGKLTN